MMTESAFSIEELEELYCLFKVKELQACYLVISKTFEQNCHATAVRVECKKTTLFFLVNNTILFYI